jgi:hypothetical protein
VDDNVTGGEPGRRGRARVPGQRRRRQRLRDGTEPRPAALTAKRRRAEHPGGTGRSGRAGSLVRRCRVRILAAGRLAVLGAAGSGGGFGPGLRLVAEGHGAPAARISLLGRGRFGSLLRRRVVGPFGVRGRLDPVVAGPGQAFGGAEATAVAPALFRRAAAARVVLAGERPAAVFRGKSREWEAERDGQIRGQGDAGAEPAPGRSPGQGSEGPPHGRISWSRVPTVSAVI